MNLGFCANFNTAVTPFEGLDLMTDIPNKAKLYLLMMFLGALTNFNKSQGNYDTH